MYSNDWFDKATGANELVEADIIDAEVLEEGCHREVLAVGPLNVGRETAAREATCTVDTSTQGPAKVRQFSERLVPVPMYSSQGEIKSHTHRMQGIWA